MNQATEQIKKLAAAVTAKKQGENDQKIKGKTEYAALKTANERIAYIAKHLGLTE